MPSFCNFVDPEADRSWHSHLGWTCCPAIRLILHCLYHGDDNNEMRIRVVTTGFRLNERVRKLRRWFDVEFELWYVRCCENFSCSWQSHLRIVHFCICPFKKSILYIFANSVKNSVHSEKLSNYTRTAVVRY